jgi:hypothetical protein
MWPIARNLSDQSFITDLEDDTSCKHGYIYAAPYLSTIFWCMVPLAVLFPVASHSTSFYNDNYYF